MTILFNLSFDKDVNDDNVDDDADDDIDVVYYCYRFVLFY